MELNQTFKCRKCLTTLDCKEVATEDPREGGKVKQTVFIAPCCMCCPDDE